MMCLLCQNEAPSLKSGVVRGILISERCDLCFNRAVNTKKPAEFAGKFNRDFDRSNHRRETTQVWEPDFVNAYPEAAKNHYTDDEMRRLGH